MDYRIALQIAVSEYNEYWNSVVQTNEFPLFYSYVANHDRQVPWEVDRIVEGCEFDSDRGEVEREQT